MQDEALHALGMLGAPKPLEISELTGGAVHHVYFVRFADGLDAVLKIRRSEPKDDIGVSLSITDIKYEAAGLDFFSQVTGRVPKLLNVNIAAGVILMTPVRQVGMTLKEWVDVNGFVPGDMVLVILDELHQILSRSAALTGLGPLRSMRENSRFVELLRTRFSAIESEIVERLAAELVADETGRTFVMGGCLLRTLFIPVRGIMASAI